jgi:hypothetical protein
VGQRRDVGRDVHLLHGGTVAHARRQRADHAEPRPGGHRAAGRRRARPACGWAHLACDRGGRTGHLRHVRLRRLGARCAARAGRTIRRRSRR